MGAGAAVAIIVLGLGALFVFYLFTSGGGFGNGQNVATLSGQLQIGGFDSGVGALHQVTGWAWGPYPTGAPQFVNYHAYGIADMLSNALYSVSSFFTNFLNYLSYIRNGGNAPSCPNNTGGCVYVTLTITDTATGQVVYQNTFGPDAYTTPTASFNFQHIVIVPGFIQGHTYIVQAKDWWNDVAPAFAPMVV